MKQRLVEGLIQIYTGSGKGKTSAALGVAFRAMGHGFKVFMISFMKGCTYTGELYSAERFSEKMKIVQFGKGCPYAALIKDGFIDCSTCEKCFVNRNLIQPEDKKMVKMGFQLAKRIIEEGRYDFVILDEICNVLDYDLLAVEQVVKLLREKPSYVELILTGRKAPQEIIDLAHYVTEFVSIKHPFQLGVVSRRGIEY